MAAPGCQTTPPPAERRCSWCWLTSPADTPARCTPDRDPAGCH